MTGWDWFGLIAETVICAFFAWGVVQVLVVIEKRREKQK